MNRRHGTVKPEKRARAERLGFRVDGRTKALVARAARIEHRNLTDYCLTALAEAALRTIEQHETLVLSQRDREVFFETLVDPPEINERLKKAFKEHRRHIAS
ncbi:MAG: DUF1778 domain-containing protein [Dongiaceae bacterium]